MLYTTHREMADESKTMAKASKPKPYFERLLEHMRSKDFANIAEIETACKEFKELNAKRPKYYEKVASDFDPKVVPFGKYKGKTVASLAESDPQYLQWLVKQKWMTEKFDAMVSEIKTHGIGVEKEKTAEELARDEIAQLKAQLASAKA